MTQFLLRILLPFLLPFVAFALWRLLLTRGRGLLESTPWYALTLAGLLLAVAGVASLAFLDGSPPGKYVPPQLVNGDILPARIEPAGE